MRKESWHDFMTPCGFLVISLFAYEIQWFPLHLLKKLFLNMFVSITIYINVSFRPFYCLFVVNAEASRIIVIFIRYHILWEIIIFTSFITVHHLSHLDDITMDSFVHSSIHSLPCALLPQMVMNVVVFCLCRFSLEMKCCLIYCWW